MGEVMKGRRVPAYGPDVGIARADKGFFVADGGGRLDTRQGDFSFDSRRGAH
jgi:hypothetical protein